jgi:hypothetical protein
MILRRLRSRAVRSCGFVLWWLFNIDLSCVFRMINRKDFVPVVALLTLALVEWQAKKTILPLQEVFDLGMSEDWVIFYNIYIPDKPTLHRRALRMIEEQLDQVGARVGHSEKILTVFYKTVGPRSISRSYMNYICSIRNTFNCLPLGEHHETGFEDQTLQHLYEFCLEHPTMTAVYMHSKGTYHQNAENHRWRRHMTAAVTSPDCVRSVSSPGEAACNVCGLLFHPLWTFFFPGNFFTASCSHVQKLIPPNDFATRTAAVADEVQERLKDGRMSAHLFTIDNPGNVGIGRYAAEHWIASHPSTRPCDMSKTEDLLYWRMRERNVMGAHNSRDLMFEWSMAPRHGIRSASWYRLDQELLRTILLDDYLKRSEYFLLGGFILRWSMLYDTRPPADSWVWQWFPGGDRWRILEQV